MEISSLFVKSRLTKRAPDAGDSGAIPSLFLRLSIFPVGQRPAARPSAGNANRWAVLNFSRFTIFLAVALSKFIRHKQRAGVRACSVALQAFGV